MAILHAIAIMSPHEITPVRNTAITLNMLPIILDNSFQFIKNSFIATVRDSEVTSTDQSSVRLLINSPNPEKVKDLRSQIPHTT